MKVTEKLFENNTKFDHKNILNRCNKPVPIKLAESIENNGVTIEDLDKLNFPVYKYYSQITIHGIFPNIENSRIHGYANIFQNKNKSVGVKYTAIDCDKKIYINKVLRVYRELHKGIFSMKKNSKGYSISAFGELNEKNFNLYKDIFVNLPKNYYGRSTLNKYQSYMGNFIGINIEFNGIYQAEIWNFLNKLLNYTEVEYNKDLIILEDKRKADKIEREKYWADQKRLKEIEKNKQLENLPQLLKDNSLVEYTGSLQAGIYFKPGFTFSNKLVLFTFQVYESKHRLVCQRIKGVKMDINKRKKPTYNLDNLKGTLYNRIGA